MPIAKTKDQRHLTEAYVLSNRTALLVLGTLHHEGPQDIQRLQRFVDPADNILEAISYLLEADFVKASKLSLAITESGKNALKKMDLIY